MTSSWTRIGLAGAMLFSSTGVSKAQAQTVDLVVREARVIDGTGSSWFVTDLAVDDARIVAMGTRLDVEATQTIHAAGRILAPGFIDVHTHADRGIGRLPRADKFLLDGVMTVVGGICGGSEVAIGDWSRGLTDLGMNVATLVGHNSVRRHVMGLEDRSPTALELEYMQALVEEVMREAAVGFSTGLLYVPGAFADTDEIISLARVAAKFGGVHASHIREQGAELHRSIEEAIDVGRETGMPVQISHFKVKGRTRWGSIGEAIGLVEAHRAGGVDVMIDVYPYERASTNPGINLPRWAVAGEIDDIAARIEDPETRRRNVDEMKFMLEGQGYDDYSFATVAQYGPNPD
jgi:N-acyl-D-amino-acid deacylase